MRRIYTIVCLLLVVLVNSCSKKKISQDPALNIKEISTLQINTSLSEEPNLLLDKFVDLNSLELIPLETTDQSLFGVINKLYLSDSSVLVMDIGMNKILHFNSQGKFVKLIGQYGKGPDEYLDIIDTRFNKFTNKVDVFDKTLKLISYDLNSGTVSNLKTRFSEEFNPIYFCPVDSNSYALYNHFVVEGERLYRFGVMKNDTIIVEKLAFNHERTDISSTASSFYNYGDTVRFFERFIPVVYSVVNNSISPKYYLNFDNDNQDSIAISNPDYYIERKQNNTKEAWIDEIYESDQYMFLMYSVSKDVERRCTLIDKIAKNNFNKSYGEVKLQGVTIYLKKIEENVIYGSIKAGEILKIYNNSKLKDNYALTNLEKKIIDLKLGEYNNDLLVKVKLK